MGQKVNPIGLRLGINKTWKSKWYVDRKEYADTLHEDLVLRKALLACPEVQSAETADVEIIRKPQRVTLVISTARPGIIIGTKGATVEKIAQKLQKLTDKNLQIKIKEIKKSETNAQLIAQNIARTLEARGAFRRAMKNAVSKAMAGGAQGVKVMCSGRLRRDVFLYTLFALTLITALRQLILALVRSALRFGFSMVRSLTVQRLKMRQSELS